MNVEKNNNQVEVWNQFILDGNGIALSRVYFHYYDLLFDYGMRHVSDKQLVEDVIQDIFINFIKVRKSIGIVKNLTGYLISTFRRQLYLELKKQKRTILTDHLPEEQFDYFKGYEPDNQEAESKEKLHTVLAECINKLTGKQREILFLRFEREIPYEEIAEALNITVDSCYKSTYRSIKIIRSEVEKIRQKKPYFFLLNLFGSLHRIFKD